MVEIKIYSQSYSFFTDRESEFEAIKPLIERLTNTPYRSNPFVHIVDEFFFIKVGETYYVPIRTLGTLVKRMENMSIEYKIEKFDPSEGDDYDFEMPEGYTPMDYQVPIIDFLSEGKGLKVLPLQTGKGKTLSFLFSLSKIGKTAIIRNSRKKVLNQWLDNLKATPYASGVFHVKSTKHLKTLIDKGKANKRLPDIILINTRLLEIFIAKYEAGVGEETYGIPMMDLAETLRVGVSCVDEFHESIRSNVRCQLLLNTDISIVLSATLNTQDRFIRFVYEKVINQEYWCKGLVYDAYVDVVALKYRSDPNYNITTSVARSTDYSHTEYEKWLLDNPKVLSNYLNMVFEVYTHFFKNEDYVVGHVCLLFVSTKMMAKKIGDYIKKQDPSVNSTSFFGGISDKVLEDADVISSTIGSIGVGVDIHNVKDVFLLRAVSKLETNEQVKGRARKLRITPDLNPKFIYFVDTSIDKHVTYHERKKDFFHERCRTHTEFLYDRQI